MSEEFIKVTDTQTDGRTDTRTEPLPKLLSELKKKEIRLGAGCAVNLIKLALHFIRNHFIWIIDKP